MYFTSITYGVALLLPIVQGWTCLKILWRFSFLPYCKLCANNSSKHHCAITRNTNIFLVFLQLVTCHVTPYFRFSIEDTKNILVLCFAIPASLWIFSCSCLFGCSKTLRVEENGQMRIRCRSSGSGKSRPIGRKGKMSRMEAGSYSRSKFSGRSSSSTTKAFDKSSWWKSRACHVFIQQ